MTVIAVKKSKKGFKFASDSQVTCGSIKKECYEVGDKSYNIKGKLLNVNGLLLGFSGNTFNKFIMAEYINKQKEPKLSYNFIFNLNNYMKRKIKDHTMSENNSNVSYSVLISDGYKLFLFKSNDDIEQIFNYCAIGSGSIEAKTALLLGHSVEEAVNCAIKQDLYCGGKVFKMKINKK